MNVNEMVEATKEAVSKATKYDKLETQFKLLTNKSALEVLQLVKRYGLPGEVDNLEYNRKVKVPKFVAHWLETKKDNEDSLHVAIDGDWQIMPDQMKNWLGVEFNDELFARAWLDGYEVEEEPKYYIKLPDIGYLRLGNWRYFYSTESDDATSYTEKEIKQQEERYWPFAVPVEKEHSAKKM